MDGTDEENVDRVRYTDERGFMNVAREKDGDIPVRKSRSRGRGGSVRGGGGDVDVERLGSRRRLSRSQQ